MQSCGVLGVLSETEVAVKHTLHLCLCLLPSTLSSGSPYDSEKVSGIKTGTGSLPVVPQSSSVNFGSCWGQEGLESLHACARVLMDLISVSRQLGHRNEVNNKQSCTHGILIGVIFGWEFYEFPLKPSDVHCYTWTTTIRLKTSHVWNGVLTGIKSEQILSPINDKTIAHHIISVSTVVHLEWWCELLIPTEWFFYFLQF